MNSIRKNFAYNIVYQIFTIIMPLITAPYLARIIGASGIGMYSYTFTVAEYFTYFALLGVANYGNRTIAAANENVRSKTFVDIYSVQFITSTVVLSAYIVFALLINDRYKTLTLIQSFYVLSAGLDVTWYFFGTERFKLTTTRNIIIKTISIVLIFAFVRSSGDVWKYAMIMSLSYFFSQSFMWYYLIKEIHFQKPDFKAMRLHFKSLIVLFIPVIAVSLYKMMDKLMLEWFGDVQEVGYYESAEKIVRVPSLIIAALGTAMLPRMSKLGASGKNNRMLYYFDLSVELSGLLTFGMAFGIISVASILVPIYYGPGFNDSVILLETLSITLLFTSWASSIRTQYLLPLKHDSEYIISVFAGAIVNLILNTLFIPKMGALGAVYGTISAEAAAIVQTVAVRRELPVIKEMRKYGIFVVPGLLMFIILIKIKKYIQVSIELLFVLVLLGILIYLILSVFLLFVFKSELLKSMKTEISKIIKREKSE